MNTEEITTFIDGAKNYFNTVSDTAVNIGTPFLIEPENTPAYDFTSIIGISGVRKGCVYFSAPRVLLRDLLMKLGEPSTDQSLLGDVVGEVANTISGNARGTFGSDFMISVPVVVTGKPESIQLPKRLQPYVIPITWNQYKASLVVAIE